MHVSEQFAQWIEQSLDQHGQPGERYWYDVTMAPGGGPNDSPFIAFVLTCAAAALDQTLNVVSTFPNYISMDEKEVDEWVVQATTELRNARTAALVKEKATIKRMTANGPAGPGTLYLPGEK